MGTNQASTLTQLMADDKKGTSGWEEYYATEGLDDEPRQNDDKNPYIDVDKPQMRNLIYRPFQFLEF